MDAKYNLSDVVTFQTTEYDRRFVECPICHGNYRVVRPVTEPIAVGEDAHVYCGVCSEGKYEVSKEAIKVEYPRPLAIMSIKRSMYKGEISIVYELEDRTAGFRRFCIPESMIIGTVPAEPKALPLDSDPVVYNARLLTIALLQENNTVVSEEDLLCIAAGAAVLYMGGGPMTLEECVSITMITYFKNKMVTKQ